MKEKKDYFFVRQNIKLKPVTKPSNEDGLIRLKFLETPYRLWYKLPRWMRTAILSIIWAGVIPFVMYQSIIYFVKEKEKVIILII
jgi:hypothetical protein